MKKEISKLEMARIILTVVVMVMWITLLGMVIKQRIEIRNEQMKQEQTILEEREYLISEYKDFKTGISEDIISLVSKLQGSTTLSFSKNEINDMEKSLLAIVEAINKNENLEKVTVADDFNIDMYESILVLREDLRGFTISFASAVDNKNFNVLDNSVQYLERIVNKINYIDGKIKDI